MTGVPIPAASPPTLSDAGVRSGLDDAVGTIVDAQLARLTVRIDREGYYPAEVLRSLGEAGVFRQHLASQQPSGRVDLAAAIGAMAVTARECLSTAFLIWCQDACGWYIESSDNAHLKETLLPKIAAGKVFGGTGLSNPMKYYGGIEALQLTAQPVGDGYIVNGTLPWVSNLGPDHYFAALCRIAGAQAREAMMMVPCSTPGLTLKQLAHFTAMEGTATYACQFKDAFIPRSHLLADPSPTYVARIKPGFILLQGGMALGLIEGCIALMREVESQLAHVNCHLDDRPEELADELDVLKEQVIALAATPYDSSPDYLREVLQARLAAAELALRAASSAMMHAGARGYLVNAPAQRKLREAYFVAIVTPAIKHLRKELDELEGCAHAR